MILHVPALVIGGLSLACFSVSSWSFFFLYVAFDQYFSNMVSCSHRCRERWMEATKTPLLLVRKLNTPDDSLTCRRHSASSSLGHLLGALAGWAAVSRPVPCSVGAPTDPEAVGFPRGPAEGLAASFYILLWSRLLTCSWEPVPVSVSRCLLNGLQLRGVLGPVHEGASTCADLRPF
jgi:hypothetical protein